jgi:hypothetical protein
MEIKNLPQNNISKACIIIKVVKEFTMFSHVLKMYAKCHIQNSL